MRGGAAGEVRETGTGSATPPCLLRGRHHRYASRKKRQSGAEEEALGGEGGSFCAVKLLGMITRVVGVVVRRRAVW